MVTKVADDHYGSTSLDESMDIPGARHNGAPSIDDHRAWAAWLSATALPQMQPLRMPQQRFEYWRLERPKAVERDSGVAPEAALG
ncbi:MAG TPA: hypothetical protein VGN75_13605, partial [Kaistia sp.]|nr:hypothetical protein [Kaistia sp.]